MDKDTRTTGTWHYQLVKPFESLPLFIASRRMLVAKHRSDTRQERKKKGGGKKIPSSNNHRFTYSCLCFSRAISISMRATDGWLTYLLSFIPFLRVAFCVYGNEPRNQEPSAPRNTVLATKRTSDSNKFVGAKPAPRSHGIFVPFSVPVFCLVVVIVNQCQVNSRQLFTAYDIRH